MFGKKKIYRITYRGVILVYDTLVVAKNKDKAIKKFYKQNYHKPDILSIQEL